MSNHSYRPQQGGKNKTPYQKSLGKKNPTLKTTLKL